MDTSLEIIGEVIKSKKISSVQTPEIEVISENVMPINEDENKKYVMRKRKPSQIFEVEEPKTKKRKSLNLSSKKIARRRPLLRLGMERTKKPINKRKSLVRQTPKSSKIKSDFPCTVKNRRKLSDDIEIIFEWDPAKLIAERQGVDEIHSKNILRMFDEENTLPFIARYRKEKTGNIDVEKLREIQNTYSQLKQVREKVSKILNSNISSKIPEDRKNALISATSVHEVEHLTAAYKSCGKRTYAERARELGLDVPAMEIFNGENNRYFYKENLSSLINFSKEGLRTQEEVQQGLQHIIADVISKEPTVMGFVKSLMRTCRPTLESTMKAKTKGKAKEKNKFSPSEDLRKKYANYSNFSNVAWSLQPHQIMAINRGEKQNVLSVKITIPDSAYRSFFNFCFSKWLYSSSPTHRHQLFLQSIEDSWERLVKPFMQRQIRSQLTESAEMVSVEVFATNLKNLLMTPPVRGKPIIAIDPGFHNGCKIGVTSVQGTVLLTTTIYPFKQQLHRSPGDWSQDHNAQTLKEIVHKYHCEHFAIGNGTACRQMEEYLTRLIRYNFFSPFNIQYTIVNESGASQYSVSPEAKIEFPSMDPNHISAVSLARRIQEPLMEYVKVHPMHLGVGMYQHDVPEKMLHSSLDSVMMECVSFVGVDINVASEFVLRKLSGLNKSTAANIVKYRVANGPFFDRQQIKEVKGIGPKSFEQCAGFVKIMPDTLDCELKRTPSKRQPSLLCPLDRTVIHPESYEAAFKFMKLAGLQPKNIGQEQFCTSIRKFSVNSDLNSLANHCNVSYQTMQLIVEALSMPLNFDIRAQFSEPLFRRGVMSVDDLTVGSKVTGSVMNVVHFGAFVDIGVGNNGLIHPKNMKGMRVQLGNSVEVSILSVDKTAKKIDLKLERVI